MEKDEVISRFCALSNKVMDKVYEFSEPADCFCGLNQMSPANYQYSEKISKTL